MSIAYTILGVITVLGLVYGSTSVNNIGYTPQEYNPTYALVDYLDNSVSKCLYPIKTTSDGLFAKISSGYGDVCSKGYIPEYHDLLDKGYYLTRLTYTPIYGDDKTPAYILIFSKHEGFITSNNLLMIPNTSHDKLDFNNTSFNNSMRNVLIISIIPKDSSDNYLTYNYNETTYSYTYENLGWICYGNTNTNSTCGNFGLFPSYPYVDGYISRSININYHPGFTLDINTNYNLKKYASTGSSSNYSSATTSHVWTTDRELTIKKNEYVYLIPKGVNLSSSYGNKFVVYTDGFITYNTFTTDSNCNLNYNSMNVLSNYAPDIGGFNWTPWNFQFTESDILNHSGVQIYAPYEDIHLKYNSSAYDVKYMTSNSTEFIYDGVCYPNNYDDLYTVSSHFTYDKTPYSGLDISNSVISKIKLYLSPFLACFSFIGLIITTFFNSLSSELLFFFYIIFGFSIIGIIIKILRK